MVSKSLPKINQQMSLIANQQPRCDTFKEDEECNGQNVRNNSNGENEPQQNSSEASSSHSSDRFCDNERATSSSSPNYSDGRQLAFSDHFMLTTPALNSLQNEHRNPPPVWVKRRYEPSFVGLHDEIEDLYEWLKPTAEEIACRRRLYNKISSMLKRVWPKSEVFMFGSVATNSFLPTSDIDILILTRGKLNVPQDLNTVADMLRETQTFDHITVLDKTAIPIVKCTDTRTQFRVDINFNMRYVLHAVDWIQRQMCNNRHLEPLLFVLKQYLAQRELNNPYTGGLPSYALIIMLIFFLETFRLQIVESSILRRQFNSITDYGRKPLGFLFHNFLYYYNQFDYTKYGIHIQKFWWKDDLIPRLRSKERLAAELGDEVYSSPLWVLDPMKRDNNLGKSAHNILAIKQAFGDAFDQINQVFTYCYHYVTEEYRRLFYFGPMLALIFTDIANRREDIIRTRSLFIDEELKGWKKKKEDQEEQEKDEEEAHSEEGKEEEDEEDEKKEDEEKSDEIANEERPNSVEEDRITQMQHRRITATPTQN